MFETNFKISWETFENNLSNGFSKLQQMQEFVDVTLAAGGHFVKAHQNVLAVASPYLKGMLKSTPCQHPVIFLGPISQTVLCFILEYIYSGEVNVPSCELRAFVEAAKLLHIAGIKDMQIPEVNPQIVNNQNKVGNVKSDDVRTKSNTFNNEIELNTEANSNNSDNCESTEKCDPFLITQPLDNDQRSDMDFEDLITIQRTRKCPPTEILAVQDNPLEECFEENPEIKNKKHSESNSEIDNQANILTVPLDNNANDASGISKKGNGSKDTEITATPLYTRSNRGSLQMVMNRFIYYLHHTSYGKQKRRWRCINYRKNHCTAYIDTNGEIIIERKNVHNHPFQDSEILKIGRRKQFYTSIAKINEQFCQHQTDSNRSNTDENTSTNTGQENQYKISIVFDQQLNTNNILDE